MAEYASIKGDIEENMSDILQFIDLTPFSDIMASYQEKLGEIGNQFEQLRRCHSAAERPSLNQSALANLSSSLLQTVCEDFAFVREFKSPSLGKSAAHESRMVEPGRA